MKEGKVWSVAIALLLLAACGQAGSDKKPIPPVEAPVSAAQRLFINNCVQCHSIKKDKLGPKLEGALERWGHDTARMVAFIRNSQEVIQSGNDPYATKLYKKWSQAQMLSFPKLTDAEIISIIGFIARGEE